MKSPARDLARGARLRPGRAGARRAAGPHPRIPLWNAPAIDAACSRDLEKARKQVAALEKVPLSQATVARVFRPWDGLQILLEDTEGPVEVMTNMSPDEKARGRGRGAVCSRSTSSIPGYTRTRRFTRGSSARRRADDTDRKFKKDVVEAFEDTGVALPAGKARANEGDPAAHGEIRQVFNRNIRDNKTRLAFSPDETKGLPAAYLEKAKRDDKGQLSAGIRVSRNTSRS